MIDWTTVIITVLGVESFNTILKFIDHARHKKQDKQLKDNEVENSDLDNETKKLDNETKKLEVGTLFLEKVQQAADIVDAASKKMNDERDRLRLIESNQELMIGKFESLTSEVAGLRDELAEVKKEQGMERAFLNGKYDEYRRQQYPEAKTQTAVRKTSDSPRKKDNGTTVKTKKSPVPRKRGWNPEKAGDRPIVQ